MLKEPPANTRTTTDSRPFRKLECAAILVLSLLMAGLVAKLWGSIFKRPGLVLSAVLLAYLAADLASGVVHWAGDSWGTPQWPLFGSSLIRPFREHHADQTAITRHDFIETNGSNCLISTPVALAALLIPIEDGDGSGIFFIAFLGSLILWVFATNQFHKWAHLANPPPVINWLQTLHLILPPAHHAIHHSPPFTRYYCVTVGWLNWPLTKIAFFPLMERIVTALIGAVPRRDGLAERAPLAMPAVPREPEPSPRRLRLPARH